MNISKEDLKLYAITDRKWTGNLTLKDQIKEAIHGGITCLQLREKSLSYDEFLKEAIEIKKITKVNNIPLIINDNVKLAIECNADGVHVGQDDMSCHDVRALIGNNKILGVSVHTVEQAILAEKFGADYLGVGAVFPTTTKDDATAVSYDLLKEICSTVKIPVVAIGGISKDNILSLKDSGISGVAVISAIFSEKNIEKATESLNKLCTKIL